VLAERRGDVLGDRVGLQEREERLLDREVAGVAGPVDLGMPGLLP
jgi:hypothetical protein